MMTLNLEDIAARMKRDGVPSELIQRIVLFSLEQEGIRDLMELWAYELNPSERNNIIDNLRSLVEDYERFKD